MVSENDIIIISTSYNSYEQNLIKKQLGDNIEYKNVDYDFYNVIKNDNLDSDLHNMYNNKILIILKDKYVGIGKLDLLLKLPFNSYINFGNNKIIYNSTSHSLDIDNLKEYNDSENKFILPCNKYNYDKILENTTTCLFYLEKKDIYLEKEVILFKRIIDLLYPITSQHFTNSEFIFNKKLYMDIFLDKKAGFLEDMLYYLINLNYGSDGTNIVLNIFNGYTKNEWVLDWLSKNISLSKIPKCKYNVINFKTMDSNLTNQSMNLRLESFERFTKSEMDYYFIIDNSHMLDNINTFRDLYIQDKDVIVPLLKQDETMFSNFWTDISDSGYYESSDLYYNILNMKTNNIYNIPYFYGTVLIKRNIFITHSSKNFYSNNKWSEGDIDMALCNNFRKLGINMFINTSQQYGRIIKLEQIEKFWEKDYVDLYLINDSKIDWERKYITEEVYNNRNNVSNINITEPIRDMFNFMFFTPLFCETIINISKKSNNWSNGENKDSRLGGGYENVPTRDIHLNQLGLEEVWKEILFTYISKFASHLYSSFKTNGTNIVFIVKYSMDGQKDLQPHHDSSSYTVLFTLNDKFKGGGTHFIRQNFKTSNVPIGSCTMHPGRLTHYHSGIPITEGERYILVAFIN